MKLLSGIIGQKNLLREIDFYLSNYKATKVFPHSLFIAERGGGKTSLCEAIGEALGKPYHEILAKDLKGVDEFFQYVFIPLLDGKSATIFIDEASLLSSNITHTFLKVLDTSRGYKTSYKWDKTGQVYEFDFTKLTFLFATTNPQKIEPDLKDRLKIFTFEPYQPEDLAIILKQRTPGITYENGVLAEIASTLRGNPRNAVLRANDIVGYARANNLTKITKKDFEYLRETLNILPYGLTSLEAQALKIIGKHLKITLTALAAKMHITAEALRRDTEFRLLSAGLIEIDSRGRSLTEEGYHVLKKLEKNS